MEVPCAEAPTFAGMTGVVAGMASKRRALLILDSRVRGNDGRFSFSGWTFRPLKRPRSRE